MEYTWRLVWLLATMWVVQIQAVGEIHVQYGKLSVAGYKDCTIKHNTEVLNYTGPGKKTIPGLRFGLISYRCDHNAGQLISKFECKDCGIYCSYNEYIDGCQQKKVQFWVGVILGALLSIVIGSFVFSLLYKALTSRLKRRFERNYSSVTNNLIETRILGEIRPLNRKSLDREIQLRGGKQADEPPGERRHSRKSHGLTALFASLFFSQSGAAYDLTLVMGHGHVMMMCDGRGCNETPPDSFSIELGQTICLRDYFGGNVTLTVSEITYRSRYELMYYTSDYRVNLTTLQPGQGSAGTCSTDANECMYHSGFCGSGLKYSHYDYGNATRSPHGRHCQGVEVQRFEDRRVYGCCQSYWHAERTGKLYPIYMKTKPSYWTVKLENEQQQVVLDSQDPTYELTHHRYTTMKRIPLTVLSVNTEGFPSDEQTSSLILDDKPYYVVAAKAHRPETGVLGDFQVSLQKSIEMYEPPAWGTHASQLLCRAESATNFSQVDLANIGDETGLLPNTTCPCSCRFPESKIKEFIAFSGTYNSPDDFLIRNDKGIIDVFEKVSRGILDVKIGYWSVEDSKSKRAKCDIEYVMTYGCVSCNESSYIVLNSRNVEEEGIIPFYSNCSFDKRYVKCGVEPIKLILKEPYRKCLLHMPTLNKTLMIDVQYLYLGQSATGNAFTGSETSMEALKHLVTSSYFVAIFTKIIFLCFSVGFVIMICCACLNVSKHMMKVQKEIASYSF